MDGWMVYGQKQFFIVSPFHSYTTVVSYVLTIHKCTYMLGVVTFPTCVAMVGAGSHNPISNHFKWPSPQELDDFRV
jgi:hypothetical protein